MSKYKLLAIPVCLIGILAMTASDAQADVIISGTHSSSGSSTYRPFKIDTSVLFDPLSGPVKVEGAVTLGTVQGNSSLFVGLISKKDYDAWINSFDSPVNDPSDNFFGFVDTAYAAFNTSKDGRLGLGQYDKNGDTAQTYVAQGLGSGEINGFEITFEADKFSLTYNGTTVSRPYEDELPQFFASDPTLVSTDWSEGAYAFVSAWFASSTPDFAPSFNVTFSGPSLATAVPEPSSLAVLVIGSAGLAGVRLVRRRKRIAGSGPTH